MAADVNRDRSKTKAVYDGYRFAVVEGQVAANEINGIYTGSCSEGVCDMAWNLNSEPTHVEMRAFERHQSSAETFQNQFENTLRYVNTVDEGGATGTLAIPTEPGNIGDITFPSRRLGPHGFRDWRQQDTADDSIQVNIVLDDEFRRDFPYRSVSVSGGSPTFCQPSVTIPRPTRVSAIPQSCWRRPGISGGSAPRACATRRGTFSLTART